MGTSEKCLFIATKAPECTEHQQDQKSRLLQPSEAVMLITQHKKKNNYIFGWINNWKETLLILKAKEATFWSRHDAVTDIFPLLYSKLHFQPWLVLISQKVYTFIVKKKKIYMHNLIKGWSQAFQISPCSRVSNKLIRQHLSGGRCKKYIHVRTMQRQHACLPMCSL